MIPCDREALGILRRCGTVYLTDEQSIKMVELCRGRDADDLDNIFNGLRPVRASRNPYGGMVALLSAGVPVSYFSFVGAELEVGSSLLPSNYGYLEVIAMHAAGVDMLYAREAAAVGLGYAKPVVEMWSAGVSADYFRACLETRLMSASGIIELWNDGIPFEYVAAVLT